MVFLCILLVVTIVNIMDFVHYFSMGSPIIGQGVVQATNLRTYRFGMQRQDGDL